MQEMIFRAPQEYPAIECLCYNANDISFTPAKTAS